MNSLTLKAAYAAMAALEAELKGRLALARGQELVWEADALVEASWAEGVLDKIREMASREGLSV